uniref:Uncharacterized protein n=1 Tax=Oryza sativa subsp. japonica TaxID=39947 RepID=Q6H7B7_ORYSJ|nr:hypothetical protein [Oryza sativa Japonica Group]
MNEVEKGLPGGASEDYGKILTASALSLPPLLAPPSPATAIESGNTEGRGGATEGERGEAERGVAFGGEACGHVEEEERPVWHC